MMKEKVRRRNPLSPDTSNHQKINKSKYKFYSPLLDGYRTRHYTIWNKILKDFYLKCLYRKTQKGEQKKHI